MTWTDHDQKPRGRWKPPPNELLRLLWLLESASGKTLICGLYRTEGRLEVRCSYGDNVPMRTEFVQSEAVGDAYASAWKAIAQSTGRFIDPDAEPAR